MDRIMKYKGIDEGRLSQILSKIKSVKVALLGDICLDVYWHSDMTKSELSRETPHFPLPIVEERMYPGAGGNAAANIAALGVSDIKVISVIGNDWRGKELRQQLNQRNIDTDYIAICNQLITNAYCKPLKKGISDLEYEDPRIDFANYEALPKELEKTVISHIRALSKDIDVLCVSDQFMYGCVTPKVREALSDLSQEGLMVVADSRYNIGLYTNIIIKPNEVEGSIAVYGKNNINNITYEQQIEAAITLAEKNNCKVCMTLGSKGSIYADKTGVTQIAPMLVEPPLDICGAGDTFLSAFACALSTGAEAHEAAFFANIASSITIKKIGMTGTATPREIKAAYKKILDTNAF